MNVNLKDLKRSLRWDESTSLPEKKPRIALYLEDETPIRTIEVDNLPDDISDTDLCKAYIRGHFERDGRVQDVEIVKKTANGNGCVAYVTFVLPEDAAALITEAQAPRIRQLSRWPIKPADHSRQPKIDPNAVNLEQVNDHCLMLIMSHLDLIDVVNFGKVSTRMQTVSQMYYGKHSNFSFGSITGESLIKETDLPVVIEEIGSHISSIEWYSLGAAQLDLLGKYCPNVTKIKLFYPKKSLSSVALKRNKAFFGKLKRLHIKSASLCDKAIKMIISGRKVKTIDVEDCPSIYGKFLNTLNRPQLKNVRIVNCPHVKDFSFAEWKNKLVKYTYSRCCSYIDVLTLPTESLGKLKELELDFSCFDGYIQNLNFSALKKIQKFTLSRRHHQDEEISINLNNIINVMTQLDSLESFIIEGIKIDDDTIDGLSSMKNLKNLRMTKIKNSLNRNLYEVVRAKLPNLQELSLSFAQVENVTGKLVCDMIAGIPKLNYFSHSSMAWMMLDCILQTMLSDGRPVLNIGISQEMFNDPKKKTFDALSKGTIALSIHE